MYTKKFLVIFTDLMLLLLGFTFFFILLSMILIWMKNEKIYKQALVQNILSDTATGSINSSIRFFLKWSEEIYEE